MSGFQEILSFIRKYFTQYTFTPLYRVIEIIENEDGEYITTIQIIKKNAVFNAKPEEILAKDNLVDLFSPRDIRTLTYLGYLGMNSPKYKILAKRLSENDDKFIFALKKKRSKKIITKTVDEITKEKEILDNLNSKDAHMVGYIAASESIHLEKTLKSHALKKAKIDREETSERN
jgi:hypothetical protein